MGTGKRWIAGLLAVLLVIQGFSVTDLTPISMQKAYADTIKQPVHKSDFKEAEAKEKQKASPAETNTKTKNSADVGKLSGNSIAASNSNRTDKKLSPISYSNYPESNSILPYTQQKTSAVLHDGGTVEAADTQESVTPSAITIPSNINVASTDTEMTVSWDAVAGAQSYDVSFDGNIITNTIETSCTLSGIIPNTQHALKIRAVTAEGSSDWCSEIYRTTLLSSPTNLASEVYGISVSLSWDSVSGASGYEYTGII